jgi:Tol biopolymer transport system component
MGVIPCWGLSLPPLEPKTEAGFRPYLYGRVWHRRVMEAILQAMSEPDRPNRRSRREVWLAAVLAGVVIVTSLALIRPWPHGRATVRPDTGRTARAAANPAQSPRLIPADPTHKIAFASRAAGGLFHIHVINSDGTGDTTLTFGSGEERDPAWSPDRTRIAFDRKVESTDPYGADADIYVMKADGSGSIRITEGPGDEGDPAWSPDGSRIAFFTTDPSTGRRRIAVQRIEGGDQALLSEPPEGCSDHEPTWSPDGLQLAFVRKCGDQASALYLLNLIEATGKGLVMLTDFGRTPDWSPDGAKILYTGIGVEGPSLYVMNVDGSGKTRLTDSRLSGDPEWSPDGTRIVFAGGDLAAVHLFVMNADGSDVRRLTSNPSDDVTASW